MCKIRSGRFGEILIILNTHIITLNLEGIRIFQFEKHVRSVLTDGNKGFE